MDGVVYIQPIFAPDARLFDRNRRSVESFAGYLAAHPAERPVRTVFGGWGREPYLAEMVRLIAARFPDAVVRTYERNFGKAHVVNDLYDTAVKGRMPETRYMLLADSDILYPLDQPHLIDRLVDAARRFSAKAGKTFGLLAPDQLEGNVHDPCIHAHTVTVPGRFGGEETVVHPDWAAGIAGSCWLTSRQTWEMVGGYRRMGVYAGEDGQYLGDMGRKGLSYGVAKTIPVIHPREDDGAYAQWKVHVCHRDTDGRTDKDHDGIIADAEAFWNRRDAHA
jgi:hypothetical protein